MSTPSMLRRPSGFERLFLALDKINGFNFGIDAGFRGAIAEVRWKQAFDQIRNRHPLLSAEISEDDLHAPYFVSSSALASCVRGVWWATLPLPNIVQLPGCGDSTEVVHKPDYFSIAGFQPPRTYAGLL